MSTRVTTTVAWLEGVDQRVLTPLQDVIDVDALQELLADPERPSVTAGFEYEGYRIDFGSDGTITIDGTPTSTDGTVAPGTSILCVRSADESAEHIAWPTYTVAGPADHRAWLEVLAMDAGTADESGSEPGAEPILEPNPESELDRTAAGRRRTIVVCGASDEFGQLGAQHRLGRDSDHDHSLTEAQIVSIPDCGDLSTLGQRVNDQLAVWEQIGANSVVRIHSLAPFLDATARSQLFQFFHLLIGRVAGTDTLLQVQCDASVVAERTITTLDPLFDVVIEFDADGRVSISV
ncbi:DUF7504 family protein [Halobellus rufus]|uniref:DUF7504 family protein n=1 Tax=Halobellus rufus TaxID=1448860 RepID=UPI0012E07472|nr:HalOD1 output domain-containing protein [Halobellus rufus]